MTEDPTVPFMERPELYSACVSCVHWSPLHVLRASASVGRCTHRVAVAERWTAGDRRGVPPRTDLREYDERCPAFSRTGSEAAAPADMAQLDVFEGGQ